MQLPVNPFKKALKSKTPQVGIWNSLGALSAAEIIATSNFDWACVDMEHTPNTVNDVANHLRTYTGGNVHPMVRTPWNDAVWIKRILDVGATSLLVPMVQNKDEAKAAVAATRYPPEGIRGFAGSHRGTRFGRIKDYFERIHEEMCVIVQIETVSAMEQTAEIAAVDGVDGVFFGPGDISADMGLLGQPNHPDVWAEIEKAAAMSIAAGKPVGTLVGSQDHAIELFGKGFAFVACGVDAGLLARTTDALASSVKNGLKKG